MRRPRVPRSLAAVVALGTSLRLYGLGAESLWVDEVITVGLVHRFGPLELLVAVPSRQPHLPPYYVLLDLWTGVVGAQPGAMRALSAVFAVASLPLLYLVGRRLVGHRAAIAGTLLFALSPFQLYYAQELRMYALLVLLTLASVYWFTRLETGSDPDRRDLLGYLGSTLGAVSVHPLGFLVALAEGCAVVVGRWPGTAAAWTRIREGPTGLRGRLAPALAVTLFPLGVWAASRLHAGARLTFLEPPTPALVGRTLLRFFGSWSGPEALLATGLVSVCLGLGGWTVRGTDDGRLLLAWALVPPAVLVAASYLLTPLFHDRYVIAAAPAWYLLAGAGLASVERRHLRAGALALLAALVAVSAVGYHTGDQKEQWDEAVADIEARAAPGDLVLVADTMAVRAYDHYATRDLRVVGVVGVDSGSGYGRTPNATLKRYFDQHDRVWVVFSHVSGREMRRVRRTASRTHERTWYRAYVGIEVYRYER